MSISPLALSAKKVIDAAWLNGSAYDLSSQAAFALESAQLLQSPETAARVAELEVDLAAKVQDHAAAVAGWGRARDRVAELEAEREKLARWHGEDSKTITRLVARVDRHRARLVALQNDALSMRGSLAPADGPRAVPFELGETLTPAVDWLIARVAELEAAQGTVFRASHDSIPMGLYTTAAAARAHCEAEERRTWAKFENPAFAWIEDDEDGVAEMTAVVGGEECETGYIVEALEIAAVYGAEADE